MYICIYLNIYLAFFKAADLKKMSNCLIKINTSKEYNKERNNLKKSQILHV